MWKTLQSVLIVVSEDQAKKAWMLLKDLDFSFSGWVAEDEEQIIVIKGTRKLFII